jgi:hypothetical protein
MHFLCTSGLHILDASPGYERGYYGSFQRQNNLPYVTPLAKKESKPGKPRKPSIDV